MIPKKIHYCWFGRNPLPEKAKKCIASWKKYCPDYEIIEWNEDNFDFDKHAYLRWCYDHKKWAFLSDLARLIVVYENGGIYFDTDSWRESLRGYDFMVGARFHGNVIALWEGIPALFLLTDSRTQELTEFFHLPSLRMEEFDRTQPIEFYFEKADYTKFNRSYQRLYENFCEFLRENCLPSP